MAFLVFKSVVFYQVIQTTNKINMEAQIYVEASVPINAKKMELYLCLISDFLYLKHFAKVLIPKIIDNKDITKAIA